MKTLTRALVVFALLVSMPGALSAQDDPAQDDPGFKVVINAANPTQEMPVKNVSKFFFKRTKSWELPGQGKVPAIPMDRETDSAVRKLFSKKVMGRSATAVESYWQRQIFSGRDVPPKPMTSDQQVLASVRADRGAIGYVSSDAVLGDGVKELKIIY